MIANTGAFLGKTIFVTGASRGIGKAIALKLAKDGANVVIAAKTVEQNAKLEGTIYTAAKEVEDAGGKCLPVQCDLRDEENVKNAFDKAIEKFGTIDVLINNASAISLTGTSETTMKKYDLMHNINTRGTFMASKYALPHLKNSSNPHILNISPPLAMNPVWFSNHVAYTIAKYGMSMCVLGMAPEFKDMGIAVNALWPRTAIWTAAMAMLGGGNEIAKTCRKVDIMSDSAYVVLSKDSKKVSGNFFIDEEVLKEEGVTDLEQYSVMPGSTLTPDFFLPDRYMTLDSNPIENLASSAKTESQPSGAMDSSPAGQIFEKAKQLITEQIKNEINAVLVFNISGKNYVIDAHNSRPLKIELVSEPPKSDVTLITDEATFIKLSEGKTKPTNAFMSGKLKIKGNVGVAMKAEKLFKAFKN